MEKQKKAKKARNGNGEKSRRPHHPWDEVSLPGAGDSPQEQEPTILQVINNKINVTPQVVKEDADVNDAAPVTTITDEQTQQQQHNLEQKPEPESNEIASDHLVNSHNQRSAESNCSSSADSESITPPSQPSRQHSATPSPPATPATNVLDIESHLIETYDDYQAGDDSASSVGIKELPPIQDELTQGSSKIETASNVRTVIEVEPAGVKLSKPIETLVQAPPAQLVAAVTEQNTEVAIEPEIVVAAVEDISENIRRTAEKLVNEIEREVLETLSKQQATQIDENDGTEVLETLREQQVTKTESEEPVEIRTDANDGIEEVLETLSKPQTTKTVTEEPVEIRTDENNGIEVLETLDKPQATKTETEETVEIRTDENDVVEAIVTTDIIQEPKEAAAITKEDEKTETKETPKTLLDEINSTLSRKVDAHLSEVTSILKSSTSKPHADVSLNLSGVNGENLQVVIDETPEAKELKIVDVPSPNTPREAEERKQFIESLPQILESVADTDARKLAADCKREYYQSLKKYLIQSSTDKPPVPLQTYRWEDLKRAKERGGYPWTHLYKRPLGPNEEPEIVLLLRKSQELRFTSESPKSLKKVRIDEQVLVKETERYIQELTEDEAEDEEEHHEEHTADETGQQHSSASDAENHSLYSESISCVSDSVLAVGGSQSKQPRKSNRLAKIRGILKRRKSGRSSDDAQSLPGTSTHTSRHHSEENLAHQTTPQSHNPPSTLQDNVKTPPTEQKPNARCYPIMKKLKSMADRQKKRLNIKRISLRKDEKIVLEEETKILRLKSSPKSDRGEIPHFIEKQDSDDVLEIVELDESPSRKRKDDGRDDDESGVACGTVLNGDDAVMTEAPTDATIKTSIIEPDEIIEITNPSESETDAATAAAPRKTPRLRREHVYEEIEQGDTVDAQLNEILEIASVEALKQSLAKQDNNALKDIETANKPLPLDRMGSSEEEPITIGDNGNPSLGLLAPISSIDSASSEEDRVVRAQLSPVTEESDAGSIDGRHQQPEIAEETAATHKPSIKKEASPAPSDKKVVTFSHIEDEAEPHREDIELPDEVLEATAAAAAANNKWKNMSDHEYEPIGEPSAEEKLSAIAREHSPAPTTQTQNGASKLAMEIEALRDEMKDAEELQKDLEERYFSSEATTPRTESRTDYEIHTSQVDSSALEELPLKPENRKKGFMASAQDRTRKMQAGFKNQAGKIKTKLRTPAKKPPSGSPKAKERKRFKAPEFSKIKMPDIKRPDMSKLKDFKRPEFTKFNKPDMSKFKLPEKFSTLKLRRSKSFKENETAHDDEMSGVTPESAATPPEAQQQPQKKKFEFNFGTYPRAFRKKKKPEVEPELSFGTETGTVSNIIPSTETQPSVESSSSPQGDRGPGPVRSRWADKFSDVSYNDSEGSRYRRYGSEQESFDRESSLERRMKEDLEETGSEAAPDLGILGGVADNKQYAEFDEENRAIHEISNLRAGEFKRRPMVHQDSDLRSEDSKDAEGWTDKEIQKNKLLRKAELEAEASYLKYPSDEGIRQETISTASSGKKVVMEEIDDDEFFLRKRGISEDNIELRQYISDAIREGYDMPINALEHVGQSGNEPLEYGDYDVPPPKPRRLHKNYRPEDGSQEFERSDYGDDLSMSQNGSDYFGAPKRPLRKGRSKYSMDSQEIPMADERLSRDQYFDDDEDYLRPPPRTAATNVAAYKEDGTGMNNLDFSGKETFSEEQDEEGVDVAATRPPQPHPPRRRKRQLRESSIEKDSYVNGFSGRSVSNSYLQPPDDVIVYRTEHEYHIPLATPENYNTPDGASAASIKTRSTSRFDEDDRTSRGAVSLTLDDVNRPTKNVYDDDVDDTEDVQEKFVIDMMENDGYAIVRKEPIPKPTPPARRKKFSRSPGERFATMPNVPRTKRNTPPPERPPPPRGYTPSVVAEHDEPVPPPPQRKSALSLDTPQKYEDDDYEEPALLDHERPESPRNLQSGEIINKMKYRPLPPPPRPPREKRLRAESKGSTIDDSYFGDGAGNASDMVATSSTADSYDQNGDFEDDASRFTAEEVEVSTQTDPLPDDYVCEEFEITDDMKVIEPRTRLAAAARTLDELLQAQEQQEAIDAAKQQDNEDAGSAHTPLTEDEQLARGLQRFRDANQRSLSERSRATSSGDRSKSQSRPQTPSAVVIERRISTPVPTQQQHHGETILAASLIVRPIDDLDLEEEALRREGLLTDSSQQSRSDVEESQPQPLQQQQLQRDEESAASATEEEESSKILLSDYSQVASSDELNKALEEEGILSQSEQGGETEQEDVYDEDNEVERTMRAATERDDDAEVERTMRDYAYDEQKTERQYSSQYDEKEPQEDVSQEPEAREDEVKLSNVACSFSARHGQNINDDVKMEVNEDPVKYDYERKRSADRDPLDTIAARLKRIEAEMMLLSSEEEADAEVEPPLPPPRRKSTTTIEPSAFTAPVETPQTTLVELLQQRPLPTQEVAPVQSVVEPPPAQLPSRMGDLEVERLRVHALQAGQIMVSQLHGTQISADDLECKSGNLVVQNIELPAGFIEDIVKRVRSTSQGSIGQLLTVETQTSLHGSSEMLTQAAPNRAEEVREQVPPPKPPRHRDLDATKSAATTMLEQQPNESATLIALERLRNIDEQSRTTAAAPTSNTAAPATQLPPPVYATAEYLQTLTPLAFYNAMRREEEAAHAHATAGDEEALHTCRRRHHHHHHHHHRRHRCDSSSSTVTSDDENEDEDLDNTAAAAQNAEENGFEGEERTRVKRSRSRHNSRHRSRSNTRPRELQKTQQSVGQAGRQFISACSLSLVDIINQLTRYVRRGAAGTTLDNKEDVPRVRHVPTLVVLFIVITFGLLLFLLSGRNVHTHHWDYFNPPGNGGRQS